MAYPPVPHRVCSEDGFDIGKGIHKMGNKMRIPKVIHYCWFGGNPLPEKVQHCIESWRKCCPDYEIVRWDEHNYDVTKNDYMREAYEAKKWGFVPDYGRLDILYNNGGFYLDTDVELIKSLDSLRDNEALMGFEDGMHVSPGLIIAAVPKNLVIHEIMERIYKDRHFRLPDGSLDITPSPQMNTELLTNWGLRGDNSLQVVRGITVYPTEYFCPRDFTTGKLTITSNTYSIHWFDNSWACPEDRAIQQLGYTLTAMRERHSDIVYVPVEVGAKALKFLLLISKNIHQLGVGGTIKKAASKLINR